MMKKRRSIAELIDGILDKKVGEAEHEDSGVGSFGANGEGDGHLARLGAAFLARLNVPEGMDEREAAERIIAMWNDADGRGAAETEAELGEEYPEDTAEENEPIEDAPVSVARGEKHGGRLPAPIRGGLFEAPRADYESMSAEQFRRLKKQLERASMDGRKIRL